MRQIARLSMRDLLYVLCRDRWKIAAFVLAALGGAGFWLFALADTLYVAESRVLVRLGREKLTAIETLTRENANFLFQERGQDINNTIELMRDPQFIYPVMDKLAASMGAAAAEPPTGWWAQTKQLLKRAAAEVKDWLSAPLYWLGLRTRLPPEEALAQALRGSLVVEGMEDTDVMRVTFIWTDPNFAALAANTVVESLMARQVRVYGSEAPGRFYTTQLSEQSQRLREAEQALQTFKARHDITNLPLQKEIALREVNEAEARATEIELRLAEHQAVADWLAHERASSREGAEMAWPTTPEFRGKPVLDTGSLDRQYHELMSRRIQLLSTHLPDAPELGQITQRLTAMRRQKLDAIAAHHRTVADIDRQERKTIAALVAAKRQRLERLNEAGPEQAALERERSNEETALAAFTKKHEELRVAEMLNNEQISGLRVMSPARAPLLPVAPKKSLVLGLALLIGLLLGLAYSALLEYFDHSFRGGEDVENVLGLRLLMTVPKLRGSESRS